MKIIVNKHKNIPINYVYAYLSKKSPVLSDETLL